MDISVTLWFVLGFILLALTIILLILGFPQSITLPQKPYISCQPLTSSLPNVTDPQFTPCYLYGTNAPDQRYYDNNNNWTVVQIDPSVAPSSQQVCSQFCTQTDGINCVTATPAYQNCVSKLSPVGCSDSSNPAAANGVYYYYVIGKGKVNCYPSAP